MPEQSRRAEELGVEVRLGGAELVDQLQPLWLAMFDHHAEVRAVDLPTVTREQSWPRRRSLYLRWLAEPGAFVVLARRSGTAVGYVVVRIHADGPDDTWPTGDRIGEIESLAVRPGERGAGLGSLLLDVAEARLAESGVADIKLAVVNGNDAAMRFYERRGMSPTLVTMLRLGPRPDPTG